jgi:hypothetical protein
VLGDQEMGAYLEGWDFVLYLLAPYNFLLGGGDYAFLPPLTIRTK